MLAPPVASLARLGVATAYMVIEGRMGNDVIQTWRER